MRIATWNVNSIRTRARRVVDWLLACDVDVLAMQEIKCRPEQFPYDLFDEAGYRVEAHGLDQWNGVAFASRLPIRDVATGFENMPGFEKSAEHPDGRHGLDVPTEARALGVSVADLRLWSLYVPNGRSLTDPHYRYKLAWMAALAADTRAWLQADPDLRLALMGDWNVAPLDSDVGDPSFVPGVSTHISHPERAAFASFEAAGLTDTVRPIVPHGYTFWDYKQLRFPHNEGMRIDFILGSPAFAALVTDAGIDRNERKGAGPSDHVPVRVDLDIVDEDERDDRPMIF
jgi:exodeoxyribonuclease-3